MSLHTYEVPYHEGKVCYISETGDVTVECYDRNIAFLIKYKGRRLVKIGDWVRIRGKVRLDTGISKDGRLRERNLAYYHDPADGSDRRHWIFFELLESDTILLGPPDAMDAIHNAMVQMRRHVDSWHANSNVDSLRSTLKSIDDARDILQSELRRRAIEQEENSAIVAAIDIQID